MKHAKTLGIAVLAAMAVMAFAASSASANAKICTNQAVHQSGIDCAPHGKVVKNPTSITASLVAGTVARLTVTNTAGESIRTVECKKSTSAGTITNGSTGTGNITSLTFSECSSAGCESVTAKTPAAGTPSSWPTTATTTIPNTVNTNGQLHVTGPSGSFTGVNCFFLNITCEYQATTATPHLTGGTPAQLVANSIPLTRIVGSEALCGHIAHWTATYTITTPTSLFVI